MMLKFKNFRGKIQEASLKFIIPEDIPVKERNAFMGAAAAAHKAGKSHFDFGGKKHKVTMQGSTAKAINSGVTEGAKPDFLDLDKDGDKKETMKKAAKDAKKKKEEKPELKMNPKQDEVDEAKSDKRAAKLMNTGYPYGPYRKPKPKKLKPDSAMMSNVKSILRHPKAGGNTSWAAKQIAMTHGRKALKHPSVDRALRKHAETNESFVGVRGSQGGASMRSSSDSYTGRHNSELRSLNMMADRHMKQADRSDHMGHHDALKAIDDAGSKLNKHGPDHDNYKQAMTKAKQASKKAMSMNNESVGKTPGDRSYYNLQKAKELAKKAGHDYDKLPQYDRRHNNHKDYFDNKAKNESKLNELSPKTLSNYAQKAAMDMGTKNYVRGFEKGQSMMGMKRKEDPKDKKKAQDRLTGIIRATDKLRRKTNENMIPGIKIQDNRPKPFRGTSEPKAHDHPGGIEAGRRNLKKKGLLMKNPDFKKPKKVREDQHDDDGANHIVMQLRKAVTLRGMRPVTFKDGKKVKVDPSHAQKFLTKYNKAKPMDKEKMQAMAHKSHDHFKKSLDEAFPAIAARAAIGGARAIGGIAKKAVGSAMKGAVSSVAKPMAKIAMAKALDKKKDESKVNEISMDKLNRYVNKASSQLYHLGKQQGKQDMQPGYAPPKNRFGLSDTEKKGSKRIAGIMHATSKMADKAKKRK